MEQENIITLSDKLIELSRKRRHIKIAKSEYVRRSDYENAAKLRDEERASYEEIMAFLKEDCQYDFSKSEQIEKDIMMIIDLIQEGDENLASAINRLQSIDLERLILIKNIEKYNLNELSLDELHDKIKSSFSNVREDAKKTFKDTLEKVDVKIHIKKKLKW